MTKKNSCLNNEKIGINIYTLQNLCLKTMMKYSLFYFYISMAYLKVIITCF